MKKTNPLQCPVCGVQVAPNHAGCEACGADLRPSQSEQGHWLSSVAEVKPCAQCGQLVFDQLGYCDNCGRRRTSTSDRMELDLATVAAATDFGKRHRYNQDAVAIGRYEDTSIIVVCDGVSSSTFGELASLAGVEAAAPAILDSLVKGNDSYESSVTGITAAAKSAQLAGAGLDDNPPGTTFVSAVVEPGRIVIAWVGDSRAYWIDDEHAYCLTVDDSHVGRLAAHGVPEDDERYRTPYATALLAWLGADAPALDPNIATFTPQGAGTLIVCSDGLSRYMDEPDDILPLPGRAPIQMAAGLTQRARERGGADNITVAAAQFAETTSANALANGPENTQKSTLRLAPREES